MRGLPFLNIRRLNDLAESFRTCFDPTGMPEAGISFQQTDEKSLNPKAMYFRVLSFFGRFGANRKSAFQ
jgi:hypothetical protein